MLRFPVESKLDKTHYLELMLHFYRLSLFTFFCITLMSCQSTFIYHPSAASEQRLLQEAERAEMRAWKNEAGQIIGWRPLQSNSDRRFLVFHGNAGYALHRGHYTEAISQVEEGFDVYILEYPGYGARAGSPSEEALYAAAEEGIKLLLDESSAPIYLAGESLGSGVASEMAARFSENVAGVLLITPFTNLKDAARTHFPAFLVRLILREKYDNERALEKYNGPVAILLAEHDEVVASELGQQLYEGYQGPKKLWVQAGRTHNTLDLSPEAVWWEELVSFLESFTLTEH